MIQNTLFIPPLALGCDDPPFIAATRHLSQQPLSLRTTSPRRVLHSSFYNAAGAATLGLMTSCQVIMTTRWLLVPVAAAVGVIGAVFPSFVVNGIVELLLSRDHYVPGAALVTYYTLPICGAFASCFFVLFGTRAAPTHRFIVSIILLIIGGSIAWYCVGTMYAPASFAHPPEGQPQVRVWHPIIATYSGGVAACIMVYFRASLRRVFRFRRFK